MTAEQLSLFDLPAPIAQARPPWLRGDLDEALLPRLRVAHIRLVSISYSDYWGRWVYRLEADWRGRGVSCLDKFAEGVAATLATVEQRNVR